MKKIMVLYIFLFLFLYNHRSFAEGQSSVQAPSCEYKVDLNALDNSLPVVKTYLFELEDYFTCKAAMNEDIQVCNVFSDDMPQKENCKEGYKKYYLSFGKLFKDGKMAGELLDECMERLKSKTACEQFGKVMLTGNANGCEKIEGITSKQVAVCRDMASDDPVGLKALFMMVLRKGDPALCSQLGSNSAATICRGLLSKGTDGCQLNDGVTDFKKLYCQKLTIEGISNGTEK